MIAALAAALAITVPVHCYPTMNAWQAADGWQTPTSQYQDRIAGFYGNPVTGGPVEIGLTPNVCTALNRIGHGYLTLTQVEAVWAFTHEWGHYTGIPETGATDGDHAANQYAKKHAAQVAYTAGLRGHEQFFELASMMELSPP